jgi:class 3 adenylate cyclase
MLVVDLRNSSTFFMKFLDEADSTAERADRFREITHFIGELSNWVRTVTLEVSNGVASDVHVDKFTGDGFLILFDEPAPRRAVRVGPARALAVARRLRVALDRIIRTLSPRFQARARDDQIGLVAGIAYGDVVYGPLTRPATHEPTVLGEAVVQAFRYAQVRNEPGLARPDCVLVCQSSQQSIVGLRGHIELGRQKRLRASVDGASFSWLELPRLKGVHERSAFQVSWPDDPPTTGRVET